jgi:hypothetical protein
LEAAVSDNNSQDNLGLSEQELQGQEANTLPDREVMSLLNGATLPGVSALPPVEGSGLDPQTYPGAGAADSSNLGDLPAYNTADTNSVQTTSSATDSATS